MNTVEINDVMQTLKLIKEVMGVDGNEALELYLYWSKLESFQDLDESPKEFANNDYKVEYDVTNFAKSIIENLKSDGWKI